MGNLVGVQLTRAINPAVKSTTQSVSRPGGIAQSRMNAKRCTDQREEGGQKTKITVGEPIGGADYSPSLVSWPSGCGTVGITSGIPLRHLKVIDELRDRSH